jgi:uncharacterized protein (DUF1697 family)
MTSLVSLLRGINVSGHNMIKMAELKMLYESLGFRNVTTYIQSGNVIFQSEKRDSGSVEAIIERAIERKFGFPVTVIARKPAELAGIIKANPFSGSGKIDETRLYITLLKTKPAPEVVKVLQPAAARSTDQYKITGSEVYLYCPNGYGRTLLSNTFFEKQLKVKATTRNWKTVNTLHAMALNINK